MPRVKPKTTEQNFRNAVIEKAVGEFRKFNRGNAPVEEDLVDIATTERLSDRRKKAANVLGGYVEGLKGQLSDTVGENVGIMAKRIMADEFSRLVKNGFQMKAADIESITEDYVMKVLNAKFMGRTLQERIGTIANRTGSVMQDGVKGMVTRGEQSRSIQAKRIADTMAGKRAGFYKDGNTFSKFSAARSSERLIASEIARSRREAVAFLAQELGFGYVRWITRDDEKTCKLCASLGTDSGVSDRELSVADLSGVYHASALPDSHPYCRCRVEIVITPEDQLSFAAGGQVDEYLGQFSPETMSGEKSSAYMERYLDDRKEMDQLAQLPEDEQKVRADTYAKMIDEASISGAKNVDRMFYNNVKKGQARAVKDLLQVANLNIPESLIEEIGPENVIRLALAKIKKKDATEVELAFLAGMKPKIEASREEIDMRMKRAREYKTEADSRKEGASKALQRAHMTNELNAARREAGQSTGYIDAQERILRQVKNPEKDLTVSFDSAAKLDSFMQKYPGMQMSINRGKQVATIKIQDAGALVAAGEEADAERLKVLALKTGKYNTGGARGYHPKGTKEGLRLRNDQESAVRMMKEQKALILNAGPGTGKTTMTVSAVRELDVEGQMEKKVLYLTKGSLEGQAVKEFKKFVPNQEYSTTAGKYQVREDLPQLPPSEMREAMYRDYTHKVNVISHADFLADVKAGRLPIENYSAVVIDEFQEMGPVGFKMLDKFKNTKYKFGLSGTPVKQEVGELWDMVRFIDPKAFKSKEQYVELFSSAKRETTFFQSSVYRRINEKMLGSMITQEQTALPAYKSFDLNIKLGTASKSKILKLENEYEAGFGGGKTAVRKKLQDTIDGGGLEEKKATFREVVQSERGKKVVFVQDAKQAKMIRKELRKTGLEDKDIFEISSDTKDDVDDIKKAFEAAKNKRAVAIMDNLNSAGHDFPFARVPINWSPPTSYAQWFQRICRTWRGDNQQTVAYNLYTNTVEDQMRRIQKIRETEKILTAFTNAQAVDDTGMLAILRDEIKKPKKTKGKKEASGWKHISFWPF